MVSIVISNKSKAKYCFCYAAILLFYILNKILTKVSYFFEELFPNKILGPYVNWCWCCSHLRISHILCW